MHERHKYYSEREEDKYWQRGRKEDKKRGRKESSYLKALSELVCNFLLNT